MFLFIKRASMQWAKGEKALAHLELAYAGLHLDEYPPAMFLEGGAGASVRAISPKDNTAMGAYIGNCCRSLPDRARIKIKIGE
jgi:hypothetical protein